MLSELLVEPAEVREPAPRPDPLAWDDYAAARDAAEAKAGTDESVLVATGEVRGAATSGSGGAGAVVVAWEFDFLGGSMGWAAGQRIAAAYDLARQRRLPVVLATSTGGARMQEGMASLVQMAATTAAARQHADDGLLQVAVLRHPTTGGVFASHANLADVVLAEDGATIGFAGPRVAAALTGGDLPEGSHTAAGAAAAGLADHLVEPGGAAPTVGALVAWARDVEAVRNGGWRPASGSPAPHDAPTGEDVDAWEAVEASRAPTRARASDWLAAVDVAAELHGDRAGADDPAIRVALARVAGAPAVVVALDRAHEDGAVTPAGYRKAWRGFTIAERLGLPVVTLVDTAGAAADAASEAGGIAHHIAATFDRLLSLDVPTVALVTGEGGSGGALALAVADRLLMLERSTFSVIAPEGAAAILHRDAGRAPEVARQLRPDARTLRSLGVADAVVSEEGDPVRNGWDAVAHHLLDLAAQDAQGRRRVRLDRWRSAPSPT